MKAERFTTQARLLATTRKDGHEATGNDTGNSFVYRKGVGWTPLVPMNGIAGQPLVVAVDRGVSSFDTTNRLVPAGGVAGQLAGVDQFGSTMLIQRDTPGGVVYPVDYTSGGVVTALDRVIPAGALGPYGFLRYTAIIELSNTANARTVTWSPTAGAIGNELVTASLSAATSDNHWGIEYTLLMVNQGDEASNVMTSRLAWSHWQDSTSGSSSEAYVQQTAHGITNDTSIDWQVSAQVKASAAVTGIAVVRGVAVEYGYAA